MTPGCTFASIGPSFYEHPVPGLAFFGLSLVSIEQQRAFPVRIEQVVRPSQPSDPAKPPAKKRGRGRPKGSKNKDKTDGNYSEIAARLHRLIQQQNVTPKLQQHLHCYGLLLP